MDTLKNRFSSFISNTFNASKKGRVKSSKSSKSSKSRKSRKSSKKGRVKASKTVRKGGDGEEYMEYKSKCRTRALLSGKWYEIKSDKCKKWKNQLIESDLGRGAFDSTSDRTVESDRKYALDLEVLPRAKINNYDGIYDNKEDEVPH
jgi:hypothetical protein